MNRSRGSGRSGARGGEASAEELNIWQDCLQQKRLLVEKEARAKVVSQSIVDTEAAYKAKTVAGESLTIDEINILDGLLRENVHISEDILERGKDLKGMLSILKALRVSSEDIPSSSSSRQRQPPRDTSRSVPDMDGPSDSPAPSPVVDRAARRNGGTSSARGSIPPRDRDTTAASEEAESVDAPTKSGKVTITYIQGADVAFKPKIPNSEESDWILGTVVKVIGEGKSRRYDVQDPEPDERTKQLPVFRTSASSMVPIPPIGAPLPDYPKGKNVLARYPDTTTFYRAEVVGMNGKEVSLKFEGEEDAQVFQAVDRRFVLDYRVT